MKNPRMEAAVDELGSLSPEAHALALLLVAFLTNDRGSGASDSSLEELERIAFLVGRQGERAYRVHEEIQHAYVVQPQQAKEAGAATGPSGLQAAEGQAGPSESSENSAEPAASKP